MKTLRAVQIAVAIALVPSIALSASDKKLSLEQERRYFTEDKTAPMVKPAGYDVTIVEYLDYQCPHCRASHPALQKLLEKDKHVRVIFRDWPVFGDASLDAAIAAVGSKYQGKYSAMHAALMEAPVPLDEGKIRAAAKRAGVDWDRLQKDIDSHSGDIFDLLARNEHQAELLGLQGTPGFIIGDVQFFGGMNLKELEEYVAKARKQNPPVIGEASATPPGNTVASIGANGKGATLAQSQTESSITMTRRDAAPAQPDNSKSPSGFVRGGVAAVLAALFGALLWFARRARLNP